MFFWIYILCILVMTVCIVVYSRKGTREAFSEYNYDRKKKLNYPDPHKLFANDFLVDYEDSTCHEGEHYDKEVLKTCSLTPNTITCEKKMQRTGDTGIQCTKSFLNESCRPSPHNLATCVSYDDIWTLDNSPLRISEGTSEEDVIRTGDDLADSVDFWPVEETVDPERTRSYTLQECALACHHGKGGKCTSFKWDPTQSRQDGDDCLLTNSVDSSLVGNKVVITPSLFESDQRSRHNLKYTKFGKKMLKNKYQTIDTDITDDETALARCTRMPDCVAVMKRRYPPYKYHYKRSLKSDKSIEKKQGDLRKSFSYDTFLNYM